MKILKVSLLFSLLMCWPIASAWGQKDGEGPVGIFQSRAEYNQFMGGAKRIAYGEEGNPELQAMIPMLNDIALNRPVGWTANEYGSTGSTLGLLADSEIRAELEMVDDQYQELQNRSAEIQRRAAEQLRALDFNDREQVVSQIANIRDTAARELDAVLLPHQLERLRQIRMQSLLRRRSLVEVLTSEPVKSDLQITDRQSIELRDFEEEVQRELRREIAKLQEKARARLLSKLEPSQKQQVESMIGDAFTFEELDKKKNPRAKAKSKPIQNRKGR